MSSLSQALRLEDLPSSHSAFQGHAAHIIEWPTMLRPKDSEGTCIPSGVTTFLQAASRRRLGRHRARYLTARLPMPPVRPVRETFTSYGSRERDVYRKLPFRQLHGTFTVVSLRVRWVPLYHFPTLSLRAFAVSPRPGVPSFPGFRLLCPI